MNISQMQHLKGLTNKVNFLDLDTYNNYKIFSNKKL